MIVAMDSCFGLLGPHQHGLVNKRVRVSTGDYRSEIVLLGGCDLNACYSSLSVIETNKMCTKATLDYSFYFP